MATLAFKSPVAADSFDVTTLTPVDANISGTALVVPDVLSQEALVLATPIDVTAVGTALAIPPTTESEMLAPVTPVDATIAGAAILCPSEPGKVLFSTIAPAQTSSVTIITGDPASTYSFITHN